MTGEREKRYAWLKELLKPQFPYFFIPLFFALHAVYLYFFVFTVTLRSFDGRMIGVCTLEGVDASYRTSFFYRSLGIAVLVFFAVQCVLGFLKEKKRLHDEELLPLSWLSALGLLGLLSFVTLGTGQHVISFVMMGWVPFVLFAILRNAGRHPNEATVHDIFLPLYAFSTVLTLFTMYLVTRVNPGWITSFPVWVNAFVTLLGGLLYIGKTSNVRSRFSLLAPLLLTPLLMVLSSEAGMIMNQRQIPYAGSLFFMLTGIGITGVWIAYRYRRRQRLKAGIPSPFYIFLIVGVAACVFWQPTILATGEMFEMANPANALMRIFSFKEIPLFEFLNSHLLADIIPGFVYFLLNGFDGSQAFLLYSFGEYLLVLALLFWLIRSITGTTTAALLMVLFIPFVPELTDETMFLSLFAVFALHKVFIKPSAGRAAGFWLTLAAIMVYSPDLAPPVLVSTFFVLLVTPGAGGLFPFRLLWRSLVFVAIPVLVIVILLVFIRDIPILANMHQALQYLTGGQAHGVTQVFSPDDRFAVLQYMIIPLLILAFLVITILRRKEIAGRNPVLFTSAVFMMIFYFVNFQRGLLRHGFNEGHDGFVASFSFLIISISPYLFTSIKSLYRPLLMFVLAFGLVWVAGFPQPRENRSLFDSLASLSVSGFHVPCGVDKIDRVSNNDIPELKASSEFRALCDRYLAPGNTFGDLSNNPMLYYYTRRPVPSYFCQGIQNVVTDRQQKYMLEEFSQVNLPFFVASSVPPNWFDATDGVPNFLRYYRITEYLFTRYRPWVIAGGRSVWLRRDLPAVRTAFIPDTLSFQPVVYLLKYLPAVWAAHEVDHPLRIIRSYKPDEMLVHDSSSWTALVDTVLSSPAGNYVDVVLKGDGAGEREYILDFGSDWVVFGEFRFTVSGLPSVSRYRIRVSTQYRWYDPRINFVRVRPSEGAEPLELQQLIITEAD